MSERKKIILSVLITFLATSVMFGAFNLSHRSTLDDVEAIVKSHYIEGYDKKEFEEYSALGAVASLGDPYSEYFNEENYESFMSSITGSYRGIGIEVFLNENSEVQISSVLDATPAEEAGLRENDILLTADGFEVSADTYNEAIMRIRGKDDDDDEVLLTVRRGEEELDITVKRTDITVNTVFTNDVDEFKYIRISTFSTETADEFKDALKDVPDSCPGLIIDLRGNPGGFLDVVIKIADWLLPEGKIVYTQTRQGKQRVYNSDEYYIDTPIVILTDSGSASASEILSGAVKDHKRGILVGEKTFGKGCVQEIFRLRNGGALKLTTEYYYTPSGVCIQGTGIEPDIEVSLPEEALNTPLSKLPYEQDTQLQKAVEILKGK